MVNFECTFCQTAMSVESSQAGDFAPCPSCGRTVLVPSNIEPSAEPPVKTATTVQKEPPPRLERTSRGLKIPFWKILFVVLTGVLGLTVYSWTRSSGSTGVSIGSSDGTFPPMIEIMRMLRGAEYLSLNADGAIETLDGRRLQRFSYAASGAPGKRNLRRIDLWCPTGDPNRVVALSSVLTSTISSNESADQAKPSIADTVHAVNVWIIASNISGITESDESRQFSRDRARGREYLKNGFLLELHEKTPERQASGRALYDKHLVLKDKSW